MEWRKAHTVPAQTATRVWTCIDNIRVDPEGLPPSRAAWPVGSLAAVDMNTNACLAGPGSALKPFSWSVRSVGFTWNIEKVLAHYPPVRTRCGNTPLTRGGRVEGNVSER